MDLKLLEKLSNAVSIGHICEARDIAKRELSKYAEVTPFGQIGLIAKINKGKDKTLLLDAHIDEVGFIVTGILGNGFLRVTNVGGNDARILPATPVTIHGKEKLTAVFGSTPPHLSGEDKKVQGLDDIVLDTGLSDLQNYVSQGDLVTYKTSFCSLMGNRVSGKSLDDRAGVFCLLELAKRVYDKDLDYNLIFSIAEGEELGTRGAVTAAFECVCDEAIAIDVSFGDGPSVSAESCGKLGGGAMLGISPILNKEVTDKLKNIAKAKNIPLQFEVMGGRTGTDADVISVSKSGVKTGLLSIPLRNMHTPSEVIDTADLESVISLLEEYVLGGGM